MIVSRTRFVFLGIVLLAFATLITTTATAKADNSINIAALFNLSGGGQASLDKPSYNGVKLKASMINNNGGLLDGRKIKVTAIDTKNDPKQAASAAKRAVSIKNIVAGIGFSDTTYALAAGPIFQSAGIPFVTTGATAPSLPKAVGSEMFLAPFGDDIQAYAMAEYAYNKLDIRKVAVWTDQAMDYTTGLSKFFKQRFKKLGGQIVLVGSYLTSDKDFSALVSKLKSASNVDAVFASSGPNTAGLIVKQIRQAGIDMPILAGDGFDTSLITSVPTKKQASNIYFSTHAYAGVESGPAKKFRKAYKKKYGKKPENAFAALGYDAMGLVADAIKRAGSTDPAKVTKALANTHDYKAVTGKIDYPKGKRVPNKPVAIMEVNDGKVKLKTTLTPD